MKLFAVIVAAGTLAGVAVAEPTFTGANGKTLPPFLVAKPSTLVWSSRGMFFQTFTSSLTTTGNVNSQAHAGWSYLAPGKYALEVVSNGAWSIHVRAGVIAPRRAGGRLAYSGSGGATLPPFVVRRAGELAWTCSCHLFQLAGDELRQNVSSQAHGGTTRLQPGTYQLNVNSDGPWSISWRP